LTTGFSARMRDAGTRVAPRRLGPAMPYALGSTLVGEIIGLPLSYYSGFVVEQQYGLSNQTRRAWAVEQVKGLGVSSVLGLPLMQGITWVIRRSPRRWWAILSALALPFSVLLSNLLPVVILPLFNKYEPLKDRELADRITALAEGEGVRVSQIL